MTHWSFVDLMKDILDLRKDMLSYAVTGGYPKDLCIDYTLRRPTKGLVARLRLEAKWRPHSEARACIKWEEYVPPEVSNDER